MMTDISFNYDSVRRAVVFSDPCPYCVIPDFMSGNILKDIVALFPDIQSGGSYPPQALSLTPRFEAMIEAFQGPELKKIVAEKFGLDVEDAPSIVTLRGRTREKDGRIHRDSVSKRVTILLYLNDPARKWDEHKGCLRFVNNSQNIDDYAVEIPPVGGTLVIFPNGSKTWHGHRQYVGPRSTIQLNYMATDCRARYELARHNVSALWKRWVRLV